MRTFEALTVRGQVGRLRDLAEVALRQFGFAHHRLTLIQHLVNTTFRLDRSDGRFLVRVHSAGCRLGLVQSELAWLAALAHEACLSVQEPCRTPDGRCCVSVGSAGVPGPRVVSVLRWLPGRVLRQARRTPYHFIQIGRALGRLHAHAQSWTPPAGFDRPILDADGLMGRPGTADATSAGWEHLDPPVRRDMEAARARFMDLGQQLGRGRDAFGLIHGDPSFGNILFRAGEATPIDFGDCGYGYFVYDLGVVLAGAWGTHGYDTRREALLSGYREFRALPDGLASSLPTLMAARAVSMAVWCAGQPPEHPARGWIGGQWERVRRLLAMAPP